MGGMFSRWRKKQSLAEILESLEKDIQGLKNSQQRTQQLQKKFIGYLVLYSIMLYITSALVFYFYYFPKNWKDQLIGCTPLLIFPVVVYGLKRLLHYLFVSRISKKERRLEDLNERKKKVLEEVMEKETYRTAKDLLEKYDPSSELVLAASPNMTSNQQSPAAGSSGTALRQRTVANGKPGETQVLPQQTPSGPSLTETPSHRPMAQGAPQTPSNMSPAVPRNGNNQKNLATPPPGGLIRGPMPLRPGPPKPAFPILPRERTAVDKLVEYLVGDGPNNRYALICRQCYSHNGMLLKEDFEFTTFRCCYCFHLNMAQKQRPTAPKLEDDMIQPKQPKEEQQQQQQQQPHKSNDTDIGHLEKGQEDSPTSKDDTEAKTEDISEADLDSGAIINDGDGDGGNAETESECKQKEE